MFSSCPLQNVLCVSSTLLCLAQRQVVRGWGKCCLSSVLPVPLLLSSVPTQKNAHHGLRALSWGICVPCNGHLLGADHEATSGCHEIQGVTGSNENYNWGEAVSQQLTCLSLLPCLEGGAALTAQPVLVCTQLSGISAWQCCPSCSCSPYPCQQLRKSAGLS